MINKVASTILLLAISCTPGLALGEDPIRNWWQDTGRDPSWGRPCQVKVESKQGTSTKVVKCKQGVETPWRGEWKDEFQDGSCKVKLVATRDVFTSEVKCQTH